jgi:protein TonB
MNRAALKWSLALVLSGALHAGAAVVFAPGEEEAMIEGGQPTELAMLGNTFADQVSAGDPSAVAQPVDTEPTEAEATPVAEAVQLSPTSEPEVRPAEPARTPPTSATAQRPPVEPQQASPAEQAEPTESAEAEAIDEIEEVDPAAQTVIAALTPPARQDAATPVEAAPVVPETVEPIEETTEVAALVNVPLPTPRPNYTPVAAPRPEKPRVGPHRQAEAPRQAPPAPQQKKATPPPPTQKSGSGGQNQADSRKGVAEGSAKGNAATQGSKGNSQAGNAAVTNYPGKVRSKLSRAVRRGRDSGEVHVTFVVGRSGGVSSVRVSRSSGKPALDQAAIDAVRRAAPFPPIPDGRASWPFTIPLTFRR